MEAKNENIESDENEILKELLLKEEDVLKKLKDLVVKSKKFFMIEQATGNVVFSSGLKLGNKDKIALLLVGRYFGSKLKILSKGPINIAEMNRLLGIPKTTLSKPLGILINEGKICRNDASEYAVVFHRVEEILNSIK